MSQDSLPPGITTGPDGEKSYGGPQSIKGAPQTFDALIRDDVPLQDLIRDVGRTGSQPTVALDRTDEPPLPTPPPGQTTVTITGEPAVYHPRKGSTAEYIYWDSGQVDFAVDHGQQNATHIAFHEYDHAWYDHQVKGYHDLRTTYSPTMSATLTDAKGVSSTYTWTIYTVDEGGHMKPNYDGLAAYQHMLIHDDLVKVYGHDSTGALREALQGADHPPTAQEIDQAVDTFDAARPSFPAATATTKGRPSPAPSVANVHNATRPAPTPSMSPTPFPRGGAVTGRIVELNDDTVSMQTSYGTFHYETGAFTSKAKDAVSFLQSLQDAHANGTPLSIRMDQGQYVAREPQPGQPFRSNDQLRLM